MGENQDTGKLEEAAAKGPLPGAEEAEDAAETGRDPSGQEAANRDPDAARDTSEDGQTDDDAPAGGVVMGAINQH